MKKEVKKYFDFDGVILDTSPLLFEEWKKNPDRHSLPESEKIKYIQNADWKKIINNSREINDAIYCLKHILRFSPLVVLLPSRKGLKEFLIF